MLLKALGVCAGGYAPGVKRPEGHPRDPTDAFGYAQGYALTMKRHARPFLDFRSGGDLPNPPGLGVLYGTALLLWGAAANPPSRGGVLYPFLVSLKIWAII